MSDQTGRQPQATPRGESDAPEPSREVEQTEGGRGERLDESPEARLMHEASIPARGAAPLAEHEDTARSRFDHLDDAAADDARMEVRRREHSAE